MAAAISPAEADSAHALRAKIAEQLDALVPPGTLIVLPTTPTLPPERGIPDGASFAEFRAKTVGYTCLAGHAGLPQICVPAAEAAGQDERADDESAPHSVYFAAALGPMLRR